MSTPLVEIRNLKVYFPVRQGLSLPGRPRQVVKAIDDVSFDILSGEVLAMVGESGCGKTTIGKTILRLIQPDAGFILYRGRDLAHSKGAALRSQRQKMQMIFQDPYESLDPRQSIFDVLAEPLIIHKRTSNREETEKRVLETLEASGLHPAGEIARRFPHHLSGGQRQRVAIAAALMLEPELIVTDEPVSMLDVSIRAEILRLMLELREQRQLTYLFITHDLSLAWMIADRIVVLYMGKVVEVGPANTVIHSAAHPYTQALVSVIPLPTPVKNRKRIILNGETPSPIDPPSGCRFRSRCWLSQKLGNPEECERAEPELQTIGENHVAACHFIEKGTISD